MSPIQAVFFDLGKTLLYPQAPWQPVFLRAHKALADSLLRQGIEIDADTFPYEFNDRLNRYYADRESTLREIGAFRLLQQLLAEKGIRDAPVSSLRIALDAFYAVTQQNWSLEADAHQTLKTLKLQGYRLALLSNAADDADVQALVDQNQLRHYFNFIRSSAAAGYRKPHRQLFEESLKYLNLFPQQCLMVGDTLDADILGANKMGIYSVWINRRVNKHTKTLVDIRPNAVIQTLSEVPQIIPEIG